LLAADLKASCAATLRDFLVEVARRPYKKDRRKRRGKERDLLAGRGRHTFGLANFFITCRQKITLVSIPIVCQQNRTDFPQTGGGRGKKREERNKEGKAA